ncbi:unnamed protein product [Closterium sp. NIES-53]
MYLMTCTRPGLAYPLSILARYVAPGRHRPEHMAAAKRVLRYLCCTLGVGLVLGGRSPMVLTGHADASWVDDLATQRSSQGYTLSLDSGSVSWRSTRSSSVLSSNCEAEIFAGAMAAQELRWFTYLLTDLGEPPRSPPVLYVDNKAMLALCREHRLEHRTKHIALRYFLARELQQRGQLRLAYVASQANTADIFTKALQPCDHQRFCTMLACFALLCLTGGVAGRVRRRAGSIWSPPPSPHPPPPPHTAAGAAEGGREERWRDGCWLVSHPPPQCHSPGSPTPSHPPPQRQLQQWERKEEEGKGSTPPITPTPATPIPSPPRLQGDEGGGGGRGERRRAATEGRRGVQEWGRLLQGQALGGAGALPRAPGAGLRRLRTPSRAPGADPRWLRAPSRTTGHATGSLGHRRVPRGARRAGHRRVPRGARRAGNRRVPRGARRAEKMSRAIRGRDKTKIVTRPGRAIGKTAAEA